MQLDRFRKLDHKETRVSVYVVRGGRGRGSSEELLHAFVIIGIEVDMLENVIPKIELYATIETA